MGGPERIDRLMTQRGKLDARTRISLLFDEGTFFELGTLVGGEDTPADALVAPGPRVTKAMPGWPVSLPCASAIIAAPPSWRQTTVSIPDS